MEKIKIYIKCPPYVATGGPEWLQQIAFELRKNPLFDVKILYLTKGNNTNLLIEPEIYTKRYGNPYIVNAIPEKNSVIILPEIFSSQFTHIEAVKNCIKFVLWESVNFYLSTCKEEWLNYWPDDVIHLTQGQYAKEYLKFANVPKDKIIELNDSISDEFLNLPSFDDNLRENIITYNPKKGLPFSKTIIEQGEQRGLNFAEIANLDTQGVISLFSKAKVHMDFGFHPGKDRIPREASACGCLLVTSNLGSAKYYKDMPIPDKYKFSREEENIPKIVDTLEDLCYNFSARKDDFKEHKNMVSREKEDFLKKLKTVEERIVKEYNRKRVD